MVFAVSTIATHHPSTKHPHHSTPTAHHKPPITHHPLLKKIACCLSAAGRMRWMVGRGVTPQGRPVHDPTTHHPRTFHPAPTPQTTPWWCLTYLCWPTRSLKANFKLHYQNEHQQKTKQTPACSIMWSIFKKNVYAANPQQSERIRWLGEASHPLAAAWARVGCFCRCVQCHWTRQLFSCCMEKHVMSSVIHKPRPIALVHPPSQQAPQNSWNPRVHSKNI